MARALARWTQACPRLRAFPPSTVRLFNKLVTQDALIDADEPPWLALRHSEVVKEVKALPAAPKVEEVDLLTAPTRDVIREA
ncbi:unnamed protein product, partial [Effrenium voratum]